jgi:hypothetical protein
MYYILLILFFFFCPKQWSQSPFAENEIGVLSGHDCHKRLSLPSSPSGIFVAKASPQARRYRGGRGGGGSSRGLFDNQEDDPIKNGRFLNDKGVLYIHYTVFPKKVTYQILSCLPKSPSFWEFFSNHGKQCLATKTSSFPFNGNELTDEWTLDQFLELANKEKSYWW